VEPPEETIQRLNEELDALKDRYLRLAAEFENFRKRSQKERMEAWARAQADLALRLLDALDDLGRVAHLDAVQTTAADVLAGVELVERKLLRELAALGLERVGAEGEAFDPNQHEAVSSAPAPEAAADHRVAAVLQPGYRFGGMLLRPARVSVYLWQPPAARDEPAFVQ
jgi:molecular chaperone GrpE